jgi:hypothetical protein
MLARSRRVHPGGGEADEREAGDRAVGRHEH